MPGMARDGRQDRQDKRAESFTRFRGPTADRRGTTRGAPTSPRPRPAPPAADAPHGAVRRERRRRHRELELSPTAATRSPPSTRRPAARSAPTRRAPRSGRRADGRGTADTAALTDPPTAHATPPPRSHTARGAYRRDGVANVAGADDAPRTGAAPRDATRRRHRRRCDPDRAARRPTIGRFVSRLEERVQCGVWARASGVLVAGAMPDARPRAGAARPRPRRRARRGADSAPTRRDRVTDHHPAEPGRGRHVTQSELTRGAQRREVDLRPALRLHRGHAREPGAARARTSSSSTLDAGEQDGDRRARPGQARRAAS